MRPSLLSLSLLFLSVASPSVAAANDGGQVVAGELWCVARNDAEDGPLQAALDWACGPGGADCGPIQQGGACYEPADIQSHASFAFNDYFVRNGFNLSACDFSGTAAVTSLNPSHEDCKFQSSSSARNGFSGSTTGSTANLGPAAADFSDATALEFKICTYLMMMILSAAANSIIL